MLGVAGLFDEAGDGFAVGAESAGEALVELGAGWPQNFQTPSSMVIGYTRCTSRPSA
jgi:hypothetical protein